MGRNNWERRGVIFNADHHSSWMCSHAYVPTPILLSEDVIRLYAAFKDEKDIGRIGYVDVAAKNPFEVLRVSQKPSLDIGLPGTFDDNGVTPISIVKNNNEIYLYYAGWQLSDKVRYFLFGGLAISIDGGDTFSRFKNVPVIDRTDDEYLVRTAPFVFKEKDCWHMFYIGGSKTIFVDGKITPSYTCKYITSKNGLDWESNDQPVEVLIPDERKEFGFGRTYVVKEKELYRIWYSIRQLESGYTIGYAETKDLKRWSRKDHEMESFNINTSSYDKNMRSFPAIISTKYGTYMFYNGNDFGRTGICFAKSI